MDPSAADHTSTTADATAANSPAAPRAPSQPGPSISLAQTLASNQQKELSSINNAANNAATKNGATSKPAMGTATAAAVAAFKESMAVSYSLEAKGAATISGVKLDALVVLKIIKHSRDSFPAPVTGQLLGLDIFGTLEVTNSVPFPSKTSDEEESQDNYQLEMLKCLREVNVDSNTVGWYHSAPLGSFMNQNVVDTQADYQRSLGVGVLIVYDPVRSVQGTLSLRALRLTPTFLRMHRQKTLTADAIISQKMSYTNMFEELPITIRNSFLLSSIAHTLAPRSYNHLDILFYPFLEKNLHLLLESAEEFAMELGRLLMWQRMQTRERSRIEAQVDERRRELQQKPDMSPKRIEEELKTFQQQLMWKLTPEPQRLELLLITNQIKQYCGQIKQVAGPSVSMVYALSGMMRKKLKVGDD